MERSLEPLLREQDLDPASSSWGGRVPPDRLYSEPVQSAFAVDTLASVYCCPLSSRRGEPLLLERAFLYARHLLREQHADGTIDLRETNFHDATTVAFAAQVLAYTRRLLRSAAPRADPAREADLLRAIDEFLRRGAEGMLTGGFHTPNHRWVMASALALLWRDHGDERLRSESELYLAEGIDCTPEGEYTERSVGIYNVVNNRSLLIMAEELGRPELRDHVRRNLDLVPRYLEPDGSLCSLNSRRQDIARRSEPTSYYENYLLMAHTDAEPRWAGMAERCLELAERGHTTSDPIDRVLTQYLLRPGLREREIEAGPPPDRYELWSPASGIARFRNRVVSSTLLAGAGTFARVQVGALQATVRVAATFYGPRGPFRPTAIAREGELVVLRAQDRWGYVRPFREPPATSDWEAMPHGERERANMQDHVVEARARFTGRGLCLAIRVHGVAGVLVKVEILLTAGGWIETSDIRIPAPPGGWAILRGPTARYSLGPDVIEIRGGFAEHASTVAMRGSEPQATDCFTLFLTGSTPLDRELAIEAPPEPGR